MMAPESMDMRVTIGLHEELLRVLPAHAEGQAVFALDVLEGPRLENGSWSREEVERVAPRAPGRTLGKWKRR